MQRRADEGRTWGEAQQKRKSQMEADIWESSEDEEDCYELDRVGGHLAAFMSGIIRLSRPVVDAEYRPYVVVKQKL
jgi:hypothetical protein